MTVSKQEEQMQDGNHLARYLSPVGVWALSFGCAVGWGAFVMPGTTFLPAAGPLGTVLGIAIGAIIMLIIGVNYHYLMNKYPDAGGTLTYTVREFGYDHGFLSAWFLILVYVAIIWANATALALIVRKLLGGALRFGFHYRILGYDVYFGEALLSILSLIVFGFVCIRGKSFAVRIQTALAITLFCGIVVCSIAVRGKYGTSVLPAFSPTAGRAPLGQVINVIALTPWAFVGFESVSNSAAGFQFSTKKTIWIFAASLFTGALSYILLTKIAAAALPAPYGSWPEYVGALDRLGGLEGIPTFYAANAAMGKAGLIVLGITTASAIITGLVGNFIAASRLLYTMAEDGILPKWFSRLNEDHTPQNALMFLILISMLIPFLGRTTIGWIVDVNTIGATIAYGCTSAAALSAARRSGDKTVRVTGTVGLVMSGLFFFYFMSWNADAMATESYLVLAGWSILGFVYSRHIFIHDTQRRFGKSTVVWIGAVFLIFFTTLMWVKQATRDVTGQVLDNLRDYNVAELALHGVTLGTAEQAGTERYLQTQMSLVNDALTRNSVIQLVLILLALAIMLSIYITMRKREEEQNIKRERAEESSKAKTTFLSNMSHDIRTPMNAIIGYTTLARRENVGEKEMREYLGKIDSSSRHLLALINDVLEMSRIESGRMDLEPVRIDLRGALAEAHDMFATQMDEKGIAFTVETDEVRDAYAYCDKNRLNRVLLNLLSNSYKFTPQGGSVAVVLRQTGGGEADGFGEYELRVRDSGIGMTEEFATKVFEAFERERTSTVSGIQGTGLGMAITKNIVDLMGGSIDVVTAPGRGTEFIIRLKLELAGEEELDEKETKESATLDFSRMRLLLVDDNEINREIATLLLEEAGFEVDTGENGKEAVEKVAASAPGTYDAVLMDVQMPVMGGYEATGAIRALDDPALARIPIIAMTANAFSEDVQAARDAGMNGHITKPIDMRKVLETLTETLRKTE